jgi:hypothetical protein
MAKKRNTNTESSNKGVPEGEDPKTFHLNYIKSPKYLERLKSSGYENPEAEVKYRYDKTKNTEVSPYRKGFWEALRSFEFVPEEGSHYDGNRINMDYKTDVPNSRKKYPQHKMNISRDEILAHEYSHPGTSNYDIKGANRFNDYDQRNLRGRNQNLPYTPSHDKKPTEVKADMDAYRYLLKKEGIYDAGTQDFTKEHLDKSRKTFVKSRLNDGFSDENLIWLMNNIANTNKNNGNVNMAAYGGKLNSFANGGKLNSTPPSSGTVVTNADPSEKFTGCVTGMCKDAAKAAGASEINYRKKNNLYGDAWKIQPYGDKIDLSKGYSNLKENDVINLSRQRFNSDKEKGIPSRNQHIGRVSKVVDGVPYVKHFVADEKKGTRQYLEEPINDISKFHKYTPSGATRLDSNRELTYGKPKLKFDKGYKPTQIEMDVLKGDSKKAEIQRKLSLDDGEYDRLSKMAYGVIGAESDFGGSKRSLFRSLAPEFIQKKVKQAKDLVTGRDSYNEHLNSLSKGYGSIKESSMYSISDNRSSEDKKKISANDKIREGDYSGLEKRGNYLNDRMGSLGVNSENMNDGENSYKGVIANLAWIKKRFPNASDDEILAKYTGGKKLNPEYKKRYDSYIKNVDGDDNNNREHSLTERVLSGITNASDKVDALKKDVRSKIISKIRDIVPGPIALKAMLSDILGGKEDITNKTLSKSENAAMKNVAKRVIDSGKSATEYTSYFPELSREEALAVSGGNSKKGGSSGLKRMLSPEGQLQNTLGQSSVKKDSEGNIRVKDTYDFNDKGSSFGVIDDLKKRGVSVYNIARAIGRNYGSADGQGAKVDLRYKDDNRIAVTEEQKAKLKLMLADAAKRRNLTRQLNN